MNKKYLYCDEKEFDKLSSLYVKGKINEKTLFIVVDHLIKTNINSYHNNKKEYLCDLELCDTYLTYKIITKKDYQYVLVPYDGLNIRFAKLIIDNEEYMFHHDNNILYSDKISYKNILETEKDKEILINGHDLNNIRFIEKLNYDSCIDINFIKMILKEYYDISVKKITRATGGTADCFCIEDRYKKYFLKIYEKNTPIDSFILENKILDILRNNNLNVTNTIKTNNNKLALIYDRRLIVLEDYIEGYVYHNEILSNKLLLESSKILGKIHKILSKEFDIKKHENIWNYYDDDEFKEEIKYLKHKLKYIKDDSNYQYIKSVLDYKEKKLKLISKCFEKINGLTFCMSHADYSKRQLICDNDKVVGVIDFTSSMIVPASWELIRSYFLSTQTSDGDINFDYNLFIEYIRVYLKEFKLNYHDLELMPYLLLYQFLISDYTIVEYIKYGDNDLFEFIKLKHKICLFLEKEASNISKLLIKEFVNDNLF